MEKENYISLADVKKGNIVKLKEIIGGHKIKKRLLDMGLLPGTELKIVSSNNMGPMIIEVNNSRLALGRGLSKKVLVEEI